MTESMKISHVIIGLRSEVYKVTDFSIEISLENEMKPNKDP